MSESLLNSGDDTLGGGDDTLGGGNDTLGGGDDTLGGGDSHPVAAQNRPEAAVHGAVVPLALRRVPRGQHHGAGAAPPLVARELGAG